MIDLAPHNPYGLRITTPLIAAAGSLGYGMEVARRLDLNSPGATHGLGAIITRTTTIHPRQAHRSPTLIETPSGLLYTGVEQNPGMDRVRRRYAPVWAGWHLPVILSVAAANSSELRMLISALDTVEGVRGIELPLAQLDALTPATATPLITTARDATPLPIIVKLPAHAPDIVALAHAATAAGADALSLIDAIPGLAATNEMGLTPGLLCGPAIRPIALQAVATVAAAVSIPVIGGGGVWEPADLHALLAAGATAVTLGSALLCDLRIAARLAASVL